MSKSEATAAFQNIGVCYLFSLKNCFLIVIRVCRAISNIKAVQKRQYLFSDDRRGEKIRYQIPS